MSAPVVDRPRTVVRVRWSRVVTLLALCIVAVAMVVWAFSLAAAQVESGGVPRCTDAIADAGGVCQGEPLPPCPTEDSVACYWDAQVRGNGLGRSFTVDESGNVTYWDEPGR